MIEHNFDQNKSNNLFDDLIMDFYHILNPKQKVASLIFRSSFEW